MGRVVAVQVAEFALAEPELDPAETVRLLGDAGPAKNFLADLVADAHRLFLGCTIAQRPGRGETGSGARGVDARDDQPDVRRRHKRACITANALWSAAH